MNESYVDPTSKYYIDRMWEEYHKVKEDLAAVRIDASSAWQEYHKMKEELADTKCKLGQMDDYVDKVLKLELADTKLKLKMAQSAWDELDKSHAERAKLHDELIIAEGQRDQAKMRAEKAERRVFEERTNRAFAVRAVETERDDVIAICRGTQMDDAAITSMRKYVEEKIRIEDERDALLKVYEAAEDFIGAQGTAYEDDQYLMLCGVLGAYNQQRGTHESQ